MARGLPEQNIRIISPDIGGGFGGKVPVYPGYVSPRRESSSRASGKWIEDRSENLQADSFARDYHITAELAANEGRHVVGAQRQDRCGSRLTQTQRRIRRSSRPGSSRSAPALLFDAAFVEVDGVYTNKPPGGVAYRCSFRVTEAVHMIERMVDIMAHELGMDPAELRLENFIQARAVSVQVADSAGNTTAATMPARCARRWR